MTIEERLERLEKRSKRLTATGEKVGVIVRVATIVRTFAPGI